MTYITTATTPTTTATIPATQRQTYSPTATLPTVERQAPSLESTYENRLQAALEHARRLTQMRGCQGVNVAIAWETVEELRTARRERVMPSVPSCQMAFERYCLENPNARECRSYDC